MDSAWRHVSAVAPRITEESFSTPPDPPVPTHLHTVASHPYYNYCYNLHRTLTWESHLVARDLFSHQNDCFQTWPWSPCITSTSTAITWRKQGSGHRHCSSSGYSYLLDLFLACFWPKPPSIQATPEHGLGPKREFIHSQQAGRNPALEFDCMNVARWWQLVQGQGMSLDTG